MQSSGGDSWTKQVSYTGSEPNSEVMIILHSVCSWVILMKSGIQDVKHNFNTIV